MDASYDKGWHRQSYPVAGPLADLPPDQPPSIVYQSFPNFFLPPFHYPESGDRQARGMG